MNKIMKAILASYARSFVVAILTAYSMGSTDIKDLLIAGAIAVLGPAIRAVNPNDPAFGVVADTVQKDLDKLAKATKKKKA